MVPGQQWISHLVWSAGTLDAHPQSSEANRKMTVEQRSTMSFIIQSLQT